MPLTPAQRRLRGQFAQNERWARIPKSERAAETAKARQGLEDKFLAEADGDPVRAQNIRKAYYARLAFKSAQARRRGGDAA